MTFALHQSMLNLSKLQKDIYIAKNYKSKYVRCQECNTGQNNSKLEEWGLFSGNCTFRIYSFCSKNKPAEGTLKRELFSANPDKTNKKN